MSLLMEALRKAEAAKRAGQQADDSATAPPAAEFPPEDEYKEEEYKDEYSSAPEVFKYTSTDDLLALSPRDEPVAEAPTYNRAPAPQPLTDDVLDDYLSDPPDVEPEELPPARPERERVKVQQLRERAAAASMFNAKAPPEEQVNKQRRVLILSGVLVVVVLVVGGGWWYVLNMSGGNTLVNPSVANYNPENRGFLGDPPPNAAPPGNTPTVTATAQATPATNGTTTAVVPAATTETPPAPVVNTLPNAVAVVPPATTDEDLAVSDPQLDAPVEADPQDPVVNGTAATPPIAAAPAQQTEAVASAEQPTARLEFGRATNTNPVQPTLQTAYEKLMDGDIRAANELYQEVLSQFPNNRDALLGLAAVQLKFDNSNGARNTYARLLQLNPQDALARTGMLQTLPVTDATAYESELLSLKQRFPTLAPLSFALGNHYASINRWHEAQSAYFDALLQARREPGAGPNPDYAFNLAVSLEQLGQKTAALEYYKEAESLATRIKPGFDPMMLRQRLSELEQRQ